MVVISVAGNVCYAYHDQLRHNANISSWFPRWSIIVRVSEKGAQSCRVKIKTHKITKKKKKIHVSV